MAAKVEMRPYQTYVPTQSEDLHVHSLEQRVSELMQKLQTAECILNQKDKNTVTNLNEEVSDLRNKLDFYIGQRDKLYEKVIQLTEALKEADNVANNHCKKVIGGGALGFGSGWGVAHYFCWSPDYMAASILTGAVIGIFIAKKIPNLKA